MYLLPKLSFLCVPGLFCALKHGKKLEKKTVLDKPQIRWGIRWRCHITTTENGSKEIPVIFSKVITYPPAFTNTLLFYGTHEVI